MSRSLGGRSLTTRSPMLMVPEVMSSSPAIIRSAVDLPHPDGPTKTMKSPSGMSSDNESTARVLPPPYTLVTSSSTICAMVAFPPTGLCRHPPANLGSQSILDASVAAQEGILPAAIGIRQPGDHTLPIGRCWTGPLCPFLDRFAAAESDVPGVGRPLLATLQPHEQEATDRPHGRHLRPHPPRPSGGRRRGPLAVRAGPGAVRPHGPALAEARGREPSPGPLPDGPDRHRIQSRVLGQPHRD